MQGKRNKIKQMLKAQGIDGAIVSSPENFHYVAGFAGHQHTVSRQPGLSEIVMDNNEDNHICTITMDFEIPTFASYQIPDICIKKYDTWVGVKEKNEMLSGICTSEPRQFASSMEVLVETVKEMDLANKTIGLELQYLPVSYYRILTRQLPEIKFVDVSDLFVYARSVKDQEEIQIFRDLCQVADEAFYQVSQMVGVGVSEKELRDCFRTHVIASGFCQPSAWSMFSTGSNGARLGLPENRTIHDGDVVKFDGGVNAEFDFYTTDTSRSWLIGNADPLLIKLKNRLYEAQRKMIEAARPGLLICDLFHTGFEYVSREFPAYRRGHLGHSISIGPSTHEHPYINATEKRPLEAGMILAIEVPCYIHEYNGFNIEDMVLITEQGSEILTPKTPHYL